MNVFNNPSYGTPYACYVLNEDDLPHLITLQDQVIEDLPEDKKHRLKPRTIEDLKAHLDADMPIIGIKDNYGNHIAHLLLTTDPANPATINLEGYPITEGMAVIQSVVIHPDYRPKQYTHMSEAVKPYDILFKQAELIAKEAGISQIIAKVGAQNMGSHALFINQGYTAGMPTLLAEDDYASVFFNLPIEQPEPAVTIMPSPIAPTPQIAIPLALQ